MGGKQLDIAKNGSEIFRKALEKLRYA